MSVKKITLKKIIKLPFKILLRIVNYCCSIVGYYLRIKGRHKFIDRKKDRSTVLLILAGYKPLIWDDIFARVEKFAPSDIDICIISSGLYDEKLAGIAQKNNWSYLSTSRDNISLIENIAIRLHPKAELIYKMDEDIFLTRNVFEILKETYDKALNDSIYEPGFVAPLIPVNVYGHMRVLDKLNLLDTYQNIFGKTGYLPFQKLDIWRNPDAAKFFWREGGYVPSIDEMAMKFDDGSRNYTACPIRFSVGCVMFTRKYWQNMGMFRVLPRGVGMTSEEIQMCNRSSCDSEAMIISENAVVGHLSFHPQFETMLDYYVNNRDKFMLHE